MEFVIWAVIGFFSGAIPFSLILGRLVGQVDIRQYGDHNPGATNVLRSLGWRWGLLAMLLDGLKGAIPVGLAWFFAGIYGLQIIPVFIAPLLGHAYSPWLAGRGGKSVAVTFGAWAGLTLGVVPTVLGLLLGIMYTVFSNSGWAVTLAILSLGVFVGGYYGPAHPEFTGAWLAALAVLLLRHHHELRSLPEIRPALLQKFNRRGS